MWPHTNLFLLQNVIDCQLRRFISGKRSLGNTCLFKKRKKSKVDIPITYVKHMHVYHSKNGLLPCF